MAEIKCYADSCKYWQESNQCSRQKIELDEDAGCAFYVDYKESEEWQTAFWKAMYDSIDKDKIFRVKCFGKEIEIKGRKFFITSKGAYVNDNVYDKETGRYCGELSKLKYFGGVKKIAEKAKNYPPVTSLPIARIDRRTGELTPVEESEDKND